MNEVKSKKVVIIGCGVTGQSCVDYFLKKGIVPRVMDTRPAMTTFPPLDPRVALHVGGLNRAWLMDADQIVISPGIALETPEIATAIEAGIDVVGDIEIFCQEVHQQKNKKILAITGSNGKTTVTSLVGEMIRTAGWSVGVGGNIGTPALSLLCHDYDVYVLELSSFQLETVKSLYAEATTILNVTDDHMDRYANSIAAYRSAKLRIYQHSKHCIVNNDDSLTFPITRLDQRCTAFGVENAPYCLDKTKTWLCIKGEKVLSVDAMLLIGEHNYLNALAALALVDRINLPRKASLRALSSYKGLPHRFELVHDCHQVKWINDSKSTNVGSTIAALKSVNCKGRLHLLLGGDSKAADLLPLVPYLDGNIAIYCFGRDATLFKQLNPDAAIVTDTMAQAVSLIARNLKPADTVLLSPACASLDQFKNYEERGHIFVQLAQEYG